MDDTQTSVSMPVTPPIQPNINAIFALPSSIAGKGTSYVITQPERKVLTYDGSILGEYDFMSIVSWCYPCTKVTSGSKPVTLFAVINLPGLIEPQYVILKRNCAGNTDQLVVDELKSVFGLYKMGSHAIRLRGIPRKYDNDYPWIIDSSNGEIVNVFIYPQWSEYLIFRATTTKDDNNKVTFIPLLKLEDTQWVPTTSSDIKEGHRKFFYETQKILIYRELLRIGNTNLSDILVKNIGKQIVPLSIDEMVIKGPTDNHRKLSQTLEKFFFPKTTSKTEVIIKMLGLSRENYMDQIEIIRNTLARIINRVDQDKLLLVDDITTQLVDRCTNYYGLIKN
jgi:hypothetical protein